MLPNYLDLDILCAVLTVLQPQQITVFAVRSIQLLSASDFPSLNTNEVTHPCKK